MSRATNEDGSGPRAIADSNLPMGSQAILISGGGGGIGAAVVRRAAREGWFVLVAGRNRSRLELAVKEAESRAGRAAAIELDLEDPLGLQRGIDEARKLCGDSTALAALVNAAGIAISAPFLADDSSARLFERHFEVNFHGARRLIEAFTPQMKARGHGRIVNVASSAGLRGYAYTAAYCASKHALVGYTRAVARELAGSGVAIGAVCPHFVDSPLTDESVRRIVQKTKQSEAQARAFLAQQNPGGRLISCDEVASAIWSLISGDQNGTVLELDGVRVVRLEGPITSKS